MHHLMIMVSSARQILEGGLEWRSWAACLLAARCPRVAWPCTPKWRAQLSGEPGEGAGAVAGFEDELGLCLSDDAVHGDVLQHEVAQGLGGFDGHVEVEVVVAGDMEGLEDAGDAGQVGVEPVDVVAVVAPEPDLDHGLDREAE